MDSKLDPPSVASSFAFSGGARPGVLLFRAKQDLGVACDSAIIKKRRVVLVRKPVTIVLMLLLGGSLALASCTSEPSDPDLSLIWAAAEGDTKAVETLLAAGADVHAKDKNGLTALMHAAISRHTDIVQALLAAGADVNAKSAAGTTALMFARRRGSTHIVHILKKAGGGY